jgi:prepilin-type N-terminal cleavage/methylation domain-containing protein
MNTTRLTRLASRERQRPEDLVLDPAKVLPSLTLPARQSRAAFTLVELLVSISIIAILGALVAAGAMSWISSQSRRNTETEIRTVHKALLQHWRAVIEDTDKESTLPPAVIAFADNNPARARVIWTKIRLMESFPVNFSEIKMAYTKAPLSYIPLDKRRYMGKYASALPAGYVAAPPGKTESAACLLMALEVSRSGISHGGDVLRAFTRDTNNDKVLELVDGWGEPLYFYRFPTGNTELQQSMPSDLMGRAPKCDPLDRDGLLGLWSTANTAIFDSQIHPRMNGVNAWYAVPTIVSSGPNLALGLAPNATPPYQNMSVPSTTAKDADDNLYSFKIK